MSRSAVVIQKSQIYAICGDGRSLLVSKSLVYSQLGVQPQTSSLENGQCERVRFNLFLGGCSRFLGSLSGIKPRFPVTRYHHGRQVTYHGKLRRRTFGGPLADCNLNQGLLCRILFSHLKDIKGRPIVVVWQTSSVLSE